MEKETNILIAGLRLQKRTAQERLLALYGQMVFRQIARIVTRQEDSEEVYQDVFVKAFQKIDTYNPSQATLATWLSRIAYHEALNHLRKTKSNMMYIDDCDTDLERIADPPASQLDEQTVNLIEQALERLAPHEQAVVTMFYYDNLNLKEIAYITDSIPSTVGSQLSRIRKKLYRIIKDMKQ